MSISKKLLLVGLFATGSFYAGKNHRSLHQSSNDACATDFTNPVNQQAPSTNHHHHISNTTIYTKPAHTTKKLINVTHVETEHEKKLADAQAAQQLVDMNKPAFQLVGEGLQANMSYLYNAQPFGVEHGLVKGAGIVVLTFVGAAYLYKFYADYCFQQSNKSE